MQEGRLIAFSTAQGEIFLSSGILQQLPREQQIATVISHEYAHQLLQHFAELEGRSDLKMAVEPSLELAADNLSLQLLSSASYPPFEALRTLRQIHRQIRGEVSVEMNAVLNQRLENLAEKTGQ